MALKEDGPTLDTVPILLPRNKDYTIKETAYKIYINNFSGH